MGHSAGSCLWSLVSKWPLWYSVSNLSDQALLQKTLRATNETLVSYCLVTKFCPTLCNPTDHSPPGSSIHGIFQVRILEWVPFPSLGNLLDPGIRTESLASLALQVDSLLLSHQGSRIHFLW